MSSATVIVATHSGGGRIGALLASLREQTEDHQLIVIDNASVDGTATVLDDHPEADVIRVEVNVGFGPAVNLAAKRADGDALVLVNDDCVCDPGFVRAITAPLDRSRDLVMAAGVLRDADDEQRVDTAGIELDSSLLVFDYLNGEPLSALESADDPIGPCGAAAAFDREAFLDAGGFDQALFAYWEDVDLALRLRRAGGECALAAGARGTHMHSATLGSGSSRKNALVGFGRGYVLRKWGVMRSRHAFGVLSRDLPICAGQALVDRNLAGLSGRVRGWRASGPAYAYPGDLLRGRPLPSAAGTLSRRFRRRRRLRRLPRASRRA